MANPNYNKQTTNRRGAMGGGMMKRVGYKDGTGAGTGLKILKKESIYSKKLKDSNIQQLILLILQILHLNTQIS